jgi:hypothetical protein
MKDDLDKERNMKLISFAFEPPLGLEINSTRDNFTSARPMMGLLYILNYLTASRVSFLLPMIYYQRLINAEWKQERD